MRQADTHFYTHHRSYTHTMSPARQTPQVPALPGMTPLGVPTHIDAGGNAAWGAAYQIGRGYDTWPHRVALKALGMVWDAEAKAWSTGDEATYQQAIYIVTGSNAASGGIAGANGDKGEGHADDVTGGKPGDATGGQAAAQAQGDDGQGEGDGDGLDGLNNRALIAAVRLARAEIAASAQGKAPVPTFGDYARMSNDEMRERIRELVPNEETRREIARQARESVGKSAESAQGASASPEAPQKAPGATKAPATVQPPAQAPNPAQAAQDALLEAIKAAMNPPQAPPPEMDEDRVREIAREEDVTLAQTVAEKFAEVEKNFSEIAASFDGRLSEIAEREATAPSVRSVQVTIGALPTVDATGMHPQATLVAALVAAGLNVMLVGPPGAGKTHMTRDVATLLGREFGGSISLSAGVTESSITGRVLPIGEGRYLTTPFVEAYEKGRIYLLDEMDAADANVLLVLNAALANGDFFVEARLVSGLDPRVVRHPDFGGIAAMNTHGTGGGSKYTGRNVLDAATLDRWFFVDVDYDASYEARLGGTEIASTPWAPGPLLGKNEGPTWVAWVQAVRANLRGRKSPREFSTRAIQKAIAARSVGLTTPEIARALFAGWKPDDIAALGELAQGPVKAIGGAR